MTPCLSDNTRTGIYQNNGQVGSAAAGNHITGVLLVSRCIGDDELTLVGGEITVGHINSDTLLAFGLQAVQQQGIVYLSRSGITNTPGVALQRLQLVLIQFLAIEKEPAYEG